MLRAWGPNDDWNRLAVELRSRVDELGMASLSALVRASKAIDGTPNKEGVSAMSWRRLLNGQPLRRADKLQLACRTLGWSYDSAERILAGGEPVVHVDPLDPGIAERLRDHEIRLARVEAEIRYFGSILGIPQSPPARSIPPSTV